MPMEIAGNLEMEWNGIWNSISFENLECIICNNVTASVCGHYGCQCGDEQCHEYSPICDQTDQYGFCSPCTIDGQDGDGTTKGNCPNDIDKCHADGSCGV